ncbi:MAG TPA: hypothetical protein VM491_00945, partial [Burkholderiaceae bacterium]|nr:hypothetical protein [Burkholderiaceae bacterium]
IADQTGIGQSLGGFVLVAIATSLPEFTTVFAAVRLGRYVMAVSDIFGTNLLNVALILLVDLLQPEGPVLARIGPGVVVGALLAVMLTALFLIGLIERRDRTVLRLGWDSVAVLATYVAGVALLTRLPGALA